MCKIKIGNKSGTRTVVVRIEEPEDARQLMVILGKNDYPAVLYGDDGKEE